VWVISDKQVWIGENAHAGGIQDRPEPNIAVVGKDSHVSASMTIEPSVIIATDVIPDDFPSTVIRSDDYIQTKRFAYEV
jgi:hypothetical protein